ncbi:hypothetical protein [Filifactor alocis]|uniref:hypothetical protein n=1 Tax=Filifactor alocis TaxID=143361 RepID=UPI003FA087D6
MANVSSAYGTLTLIAKSHDIIKKYIEIFKDDHGDIFIGKTVLPDKEKTDIKDKLSHVCDEHKEIYDFSLISYIFQDDGRWCYRNIIEPKYGSFEKNTNNTIVKNILKSGPIYLVFNYKDEEFGSEVFDEVKQVYKLSLIKELDEIYIRKIDCDYNDEINHPLTKETLFNIFEYQDALDLKEFNDFDNCVTNLIREHFSPDFSIILDRYEKLEQKEKEKFHKQFIRQIKTKKAPKIRMVHCDLMGGVETLRNNRIEENLTKFIAVYLINKESYTKVR